MEKKTIFGVGIDISHPTIKSCKTKEEISELGIFSHLSFEDKDAAEIALCNTIGIKINNEEEKDAFQ